MKFKSFSVRFEKRRQKFKNSTKISVKKNKFSYTKSLSKEKCLICAKSNAKREKEELNESTIEAPVKFP
jgi:hypothetical protein